MHYEIIIGTPNGLCFPSGLWYIHPPYRLRLIGSTFQLLRQFVQPSLHSVLLDVLERLAVYARRSIIGFATFVGDMP